MRIVWTLTALLVLSSPVSANQVLRLEGSPQRGYIEIPADVLLEAPAMTVEAWVSVRDPRAGACSSIAGTGYITGWWLGLCGTAMRSYFDGVGSIKTGGVIPDAPTVWIHIAAVTDGTTRRHYINGELVFEGAETTTRSASAHPLRIGSDFDWDFMVAGVIDDLRIWKVARTQAQIRQTMHARYTTEANDTARIFDSLEAWYRFEGNALDSWHSHHGTIVGAGIRFESATAFPLPPKRRAAAH